MRFSKNIFLLFLNEFNKGLYPHSSMFIKEFFFVGATQCRMNLYKVKCFEKLKVLPRTEYTHDVMDHVPAVTEKFEEKYMEI
jgi:hypothetical protein